jgi:pyruvate dehydrogenase E2 component (dihydrolipoamide acetyltransferase)
MEREIKIPDIGDFEEVDVIEVLVAPGARVGVEQGLIVIESEKASMEIPSPVAGTVREVKVKVGDKVSQGTLIAIMDAASEPRASDARAEAPPSRAGASGAGGAKLAATPAPKASVATAATAGMPRAEARTIPPLAPAPLEASASSVAAAKPNASPAVRKFARELGVDLAHVPGTAAHGRITKEDVQRYVKHAMSIAGTQTGAGFAVPELPAVDFTQFGEVTVQPLTKIQKVAGRNLHRSWVTIPHVTQHDEADITELEALRARMKEQSGAKLTLTSFFMKAVVVVLKAMPRFNASLDRTGENLVFKHYFHIGVAVDTPNGLVVPVIRDVDTKDLRSLAVELDEVSARARARRLSPQDLQGGSMTLSSLGGIGGLKFTPIINPPEVCVLGVSRATLRPTYRDGALVPRLICPVSLSYDHRVIDGADGARFTTKLCQVLAEPATFVEGGHP